MADKKTKLCVLNAIADIGLQQLDNSLYSFDAELADADAVLLRSAKIHDETFSEALLAIGRAGAGVNNIPVNKMTEVGIPVFNAPGANANAVKELVIAALLLGARNIPAALHYVSTLKSDNENIDKEVETQKKLFKGSELPGKTLGVIGLGAIGVEVANIAESLGMNVIGYDPGITIKRAWSLSSTVTQAEQLIDLLSNADFISIHVPLFEATKSLINAENLTYVKPHAQLLNFSRSPIVDSKAVVDALNSGTLAAYINDFPSKETLDHDKVISLPHLGASTIEAEENCAVMVAKQVDRYIQYGEIVNSVNMPTIKLNKPVAYRITVIHKNLPDMVAQISHVLGKASVNISRMVNESRQEIAYTVADLEKQPTINTIQEIEKISNIIKVRVL